MRFVGVAAIVGIAGLVAWLLLSRTRERTQTRESPLGSAPHVVDGGASTEEAIVLSSEAQQATRAPEAAWISGLVRSQSGVPVAGAVLTWTALDAALLDRARAWPALDWSRVEAKTLTTTSGVDGRYRFAAERIPFTGRSVLWVTHPEYLAQCVDLDFSQDAPPQFPDFQLSEAPRITARVIDADGAPVAGATVMQFPDLWSRELGPERSVNTERSLPLRRSTTTDAQGRAELCPFPAQQWVYAESAGLRSQEWLGSHPASITLSLRPTFIAAGTVTMPAGLAQDPGLSVRCSRRFEKEVWPLARVSVAADGSFGPAPLPLLDAQEYVFHLNGAGIAQAEVAILPPRPDERVTIDFRPQTAVAVSVRVVDPDNTPLADAVVSVHWGVESGGFQKVERITDERGLARFPEAAPGPFWVRVRRAGFAPVLRSLGPAGPEMEPAEIQLARAGAIRGRCTHDGEPVTRFVLLFWKDHANECVSLSVDDSPDGSFELTEAPFGEISIMATSAELPSTPAQRVQVSADRTAEIVLEFPRGLDGHGRVVDAMKGAPIAHARVQRNTSGGGHSLRPEGNPAVTESDGRFQLRNLRTGDNFLEVSAPGYASISLSPNVSGDTPVDLGTMGLHAKQHVRVHLRSDEAVDFTAYYSDLQGAKVLDLATFSADGTRDFGLVDPGWYLLRVRHPDATTEQWQFEVSPGRDTELEIPIQTHRCTIELVTASGDPLQPECWLGVYSLGDSGERVARYYLVPENQRVAIPAEQGDEDVVLELTDVADKVLSVVHRRASELAEGATVRIEIGANPCTVRVVDARGKRLPGVQVTLTNADGRPRWTQFLQSNDDGECLSPDVDFSALLVGLIHPVLGTMPAKRIEIGRDSREPIELVLEPDRALEVRFVEGTTPASRIGVHATDIAGVAHGLGPAFTDGDGLAKWGPVSVGEFTVAVTHPGYWRSEAHVTLDDHTGPRTVQVRRLGSVAFEVRDAFGDPVEGVQIELHSDEFDTSVSEWVARGRCVASGLSTSAMGVLTVDGLPSGSFRWNVLGADGDSPRGTIVVRPLVATIVQVTMR